MSRSQGRATALCPPISVDARPPATEGLIPVSIFDVDRTLTRLPTYSPFLIFAARRVAPWRLLFVPIVILAMLAHVARLLPRPKLKTLMHRLMIGLRLKERDAARLADAFALHLMERGLYDQGIRLIAAERAAGRRVILATAAPHFYVSALARRLGLSDVIATASSWDGACLTPAIAGDNCYGPAKCAMIRDYLAANGLERNGLHIRFYSDHASDLTTFELCDEPFAVNPSRRLRTIAQQRGWPVLDWRKAASAG